VREIGRLYSQLQALLSVAAQCVAGVLQCVKSVDSTLSCREEDSTTQGGEDPLDALSL